MVKKSVTSELTHEDYCSSCGRDVALNKYKLLIK